jgi:hypothetical protein
MSIETMAPAPLPLPPTGLGPAEGVRAESMPMPARLRFPVPPPASAGGSALVQEVYGRSASATSQMAANVLSLKRPHTSEVEAPCQHRQKPAASVSACEHLMRRALEEQLT